ncbi:MAG: hypothetical protein HYR63_01860 [Proteobacteria bacterium]|nr:hypothetical protein [Pseudomonadota bacterium]
MRRLLTIAFVAMIALLPVSGYAQQAAPAPAPAMPQLGGLSGGKALAIGAGILVGAVIVSTPLSVRGATLLGALAGGVLASWWYDERSAALALDPTKKAP